jgi:hypothetical protein
MGDVRGRLERLLCVLAAELPLELLDLLLLEKVEGTDDQLPLVVSLFAESSSSSSSSSSFQRGAGLGEWYASG